MAKVHRKAMSKHNTPTLDDSQFAALASLLRLRNGSSRESARLVLVEGLRICDAAARTGLSQPAVSNAISRCCRGMRLAQIVVGMDS